MDKRNTEYAPMGIGITVRGVGRGNRENSLRRNIKLNTFEDLLDELGKIERAKEIKTFGVWSVYQILEHMSENLYGSLHGFPKHQPRIVRMTIGKFMLRKILKSGFMRSGYPNPNTPKTREEGDILSSLQKLRSIIEEFRSHQGTFAMHPVFDKLTGEEWSSLHLIHFSLHLSHLEVVEGEKKTPVVAEKITIPEPVREVSRASYVLSETEIIIEDEDEDPPAPSEQDTGVISQSPESEVKSPEPEKQTYFEEKIPETPEERMSGDTGLFPGEGENSEEKSGSVSKKKSSTKKNDTSSAEPIAKKRNSGSASKKKSPGAESPTPPEPKAKKKSAGKKK